MQTVNIEMPDGTIRELTLVDYTPEQLLDLAASLNRLRGLVLKARLALTPPPVEQMEQANVIVGNIFGNRVMEFVKGKDARITMATMLGPTFLPECISTMVEACKFFGNRPDDLAALNSVTMAFNY